MRSATGGEPTAPEVSDQGVEAQVRWERIGDEWHAEMDGRVHDYGDGGGPEEDAFLAVLTPDAGGRWKLAIEHESRGGGAEQMWLAGPIEAALREAEREMRVFREKWEDAVDEAGDDD